MSKIPFEEFRALVLADEQLQVDLRRFTDRRAFVDRVLELSREHNFQFTAADIEEEMRNGRRIWNEHEQ